MEFEASLIDPLNLPVDWQVLGFPDLVFFQEGPGIRNWQYVERDGVRFVNIRCLEDGRLITSKMSQISKEEAYGKYSHFLLDTDDYVVSSSGTLGRVATVQTEDLPCCLNTSVIRMRPANDRLERGYLKYFLLSDYYKSQIFAFANGSAQLNYGPSHLKQMEIIAPPVADQKAIAHILGTLDDKIELNRKTNETLEAMAKALFKSWFVDFDPVRAKAEGRPTGLPGEISDLFPDSFEDSEMGEIPSGWRDGEIQDVAELNPETWGSRNQPLSVRYLDLSNVKHGKIDIVEEYQWEDAPSRARRILKTGDTVVGTVRPGNGSYCLIGEDGITGSTGFAVLRPKNKNDSAFVYLGSCSKENINRLAHLADGGAYPAVRPELVAQTPVIIAARDLLDCFSRSVWPLFAAAEERKQSSKLLCQVRDALLPKLISGEIRIPDAEKMLEEAGL
jgi:type I restriction enzyme S subunit